MVGLNLDKMEERVVGLKFKEMQIDGIKVKAFTGKTHGFSKGEKHKKEKIVLHHTAGNIYGDLLTLTLPKMVSTAYVISESGTIYNLFNPDFWSYHLGRGALGGNARQSKLSVAIELSNYGWLHRNGDTLYTCYKNKVGEYATPYCKISDTHLYTEVPEFRGQRYFCNYTEKQYASLKLLIDYLCKRYDIPLDFLDEKVRLKHTNDVIKFKGIVTHVNYVHAGKWDVSPTFNWKQIGG